MKGTVRLAYNGLGSIRDDLKASASKVVRKTAFDVLAFMAQIVAVDTGYLRASLSPGAPDNIFEIRPGGLVAIIGTNVDYGPHVNYGTVHMAAQPFLEPAVEANRQPFEQAMSQLLKGA